MSVLIAAHQDDEALSRLLPEIPTYYEVIVCASSASEPLQALCSAHGCTLKIDRAQRSRQFNTAALAAQADWLLFLHADSTLCAKSWRAVEQHIKHRSEAACFRLKFDSAHPILRFSAFVARLNWSAIRFGDQGILVKSRLFYRCGGFDENLNLMEDQVLMRQLKRVGGFRILPAFIRTSARRYRRNGVFRLQLLFFFIWIWFYLGASQRQLTHFYNTHIR